jgi:hypothetical protein
MMESGDHFVLGKILRECIVVDHLLIKIILQITTAVRFMRLTLCKFSGKLITLQKSFRPELHSLKQKIKQPDIR